MNTLKLFSIKDRVALITGGAGFLGEKHAEALLDGGAKVALLDSDDGALNKRVETLKQTYPASEIAGYDCNIIEEEKVELAVRDIEEGFGPIDILINNASFNPQVKEGNEKVFERFEHLSLESWHLAFEAGLTGAFLMSQIVGEKMAERRRGVILNIASDLSVIAPDQRLYRKKNVPEEKQPVKPVTYSVEKHGLIGLTRYLATYWADKGVRVNAVSFGGVHRDQSEEFVKKISQLIPMGRMAEPDEYKGVVLFLCSDASSYMTGANVIMDGGRTAW